MQHLQPPGATWAPLTHRAMRPPLCECLPARLTGQPTDNPRNNLGTGRVSSPGEPMKARYLLVPALLALTGCVIDVGRNGSAVQYSSESVEMDDSEVVRVDLKMGAGDLRITDGGAKLMRGDFAYSVPSWKPQVRYNRSGKHASLTIEQPDTHHTRLGNTKYNWDLQLNKKAPVELALHFGAGQARLDLGSLDLRGVELDMGVGQLDMDLRGAPKHSYNVAIHGGIGEATAVSYTHLTLPTKRIV